MKKRFDNAISDYSDAIDINPEFAVAYQNRGSAYFIKGDYQKAISDYSKALKLNPDDAVIYTSRGMAYLSEKDYQKALEEFNKAIELNPEYANAYINRGTCYNHIHQINKAAADYKKALELNPGSALNKKMTKYIELAASGWNFQNPYRYPVPDGQASYIQDSGPAGYGGGGYTGLKN